MNCFGCSSVKTNLTEENKYRLSTQWEADITQILFNSMLFVILSVDNDQKQTQMLRKRQWPTADLWTTAFPCTHFWVWVIALSRFWHTLDTYTWEQLIIFHLFISVGPQHGKQSQRSASVSELSSGWALPALTSLSRLLVIQGVKRFLIRKHMRNNFQILV